MVWNLVFTELHKGLEVLRRLCLPYDMTGIVNGLGMGPGKQKKEVVLQ